MRVFLSFILYSIFFLILVSGALFLRNGDSLVQSLVKAKHESPEGVPFREFLDIFVSEARLVSEQVVVNATRYRVNSIEGLRFVSDKKFRQIFNCWEGVELSSGEVQVLKNKLGSYPWIRTYRVEKKFYPERINIEIEEEKPAFIADYLDVSWIVSDEGVLLEPSGEIDDPELAIELMKLPRLLNLEPGEEDGSTYLSSMNERLRYVIRNFQNIDLAGGFPFVVSSLTLVPGGGIRVETFDGSPASSILFEVRSLEEAKVLLGRLRVVLRDLKVRGESYKELDFRFQDQVIKR